MFLATSAGVLVGKLARSSFQKLKILRSAKLLYTNSNLNVRFRDIVPASTVPSSSAGSQDILLQNMQSAKESSDVLSAVARHSSIMNSQHVLQALKTLFTLQKTQSSRLSNGEIVNSKEFRKLCEVLRSQIRHFHLNELTDVLKYLGYLNVPANAKIISIVLHLISKQVNDLTLQQIIFLDFVMKDFKTTPLVKALRIAMPIVFEANLKTKCDFDDVSQMSELLCYAAKRKNMENSADMLVHNITEKRDNINFKDAKNIVYAVTVARFVNEDYKLLLHHALDVITDSIDKLDFYEMESLLARLLQAYVTSNDDSMYYHEEFCNSCVRMVIDTDCSLEQCFWILKKIYKFNHTHLPFLDHISKKIEKEPWKLEQSGATLLISYLTALSHADYKPTNWDRIKSVVINTSQGLMDRMELPWLHLVTDLCVMDCWVEDLFRMVFDHNFLKSFMARNNKLDQVTLLLLDQVAATLSPWPIKPRAPQDIIANIIPIVGVHSHSITYPLQAALQHGLGGQEYVLTDAVSPLGHCLDHVVVMRKGGYPVAINFSSSSEGKERFLTDSIQVPPDSKMVAVLFVVSKFCSTNNERVRGKYRLQINSIEALGISVVPILQPVWNTLPEFERIPYLMRAIREKLPSEEMTDVVTPV